jgi:hypothetical protein
MDAYNRVQAVEQALGRVQNYMCELAEAGVKLAALPRAADSHGSSAQQAFGALRDAKIISRSSCRKLVQAQVARTRIEHGYVQTPARDVHRAAISCGTQLAASSVRTATGSSRSSQNRIPESFGGLRESARVQPSAAQFQA